MSSINENDATSNVAVTMTMILGAMVVGIGVLILFQTPTTTTTNDHDRGHWLPDKNVQPTKWAYEMFVLGYTPIWIFGFACIVVFQWYEQFDKWSYLHVTLGFAVPLVVQPFLWPSAGCSSPDVQRPFVERYSTKANVWIAIYSFIGNYWYTHYFYSVLKAEYTMPSHRLNNVPLLTFFATHFYFSTYHLFSNMLLRKVVTSYQATWSRTLLFVMVVVCFSYFTAFMETLTISSFPYYSFHDRNMAYIVGSAFYGIYFLVSFPAFFHFDNDIDMDLVQPQSKQTQKKDKEKVALHIPTKSVTLWDTVVSSCGYGMIIMILLDMVRLYLDIPLVVGSSNVTCTLQDIM